MCERCANKAHFTHGAALGIKESHAERVTSSHQGDSQDTLSRSGRTQEGKGKRPIYKYVNMENHSHTVTRQGLPKTPHPGFHSKGRLQKQGVRVKP